MKQINEEDATLAHCHYQQLLEETLEKKFRHYRPTTVLKQCQDYRNWDAAAVIYLSLKDWAAALKCTIQTAFAPETGEAETSRIFDYHSRIHKENQVSLNEATHMILILSDFWCKNSLSMELLEEHLLSHLEYLSDALYEMIQMKPPPQMPFSSRVFLQVTQQCLDNFKKFSPLASKLLLVSLDLLLSD